ncbi:hypothetical protein B0H16DRAFT_1689587 [Mycena metata]|uniref:Uncharacterized protein n=1 Tax=Mycena metata TaxID=1033252 RepID=A0AAD7NEJ0_9AGAR|nr:hypothetical protein B0H16DRAFT_1689587 [Mycena metata]
MSLASQILLRPRPPITTVGTAWIPFGLEYAPIHLSHQDPPPKLKKEWDLLEFNCSITLNKYLVEYHQNITPLPYLDESVDICALYVQLRSGAHSEYVEKLVDFRRRTMEEMIGWWRSLPSNAQAETAIPAEYAMLDDEAFVQKLSRPLALSTDDNGLELKSWACMFRTVDDWLLRRWTPYQQRVYRRHSEPHPMCTAEYRLRGSSTFSCAFCLGADRNLPDKSTTIRTSLFAHSSVFEGLVTSLHFVHPISLWKTLATLCYRHRRSSAPLT